MRGAPRPGTRQPAKPRTGTLGGSNRMLPAREVAAILAVPERTVRDKWREMGTTGVQDRQAPSVERTRRARLDRPPDRMKGPWVVQGDVGSVAGDAEVVTSTPHVSSSGSMTPTGRIRGIANARPLQPLPSPVPEPGAATLFDG
jgi:hypothetical protein